jgi:carbonic anhydrase/acetyltransferase-like protein (isoleucine patch superfamily)
MPEGRRRLIARDGYYAAENATIVGEVRIGRDVSIWYGAVVRGDIAPITIGELTNIQDNCVLHCDPGQDLSIGRRVTVGHMAMIHAQEVGDDCLIGIGSILLGGSKVGAGSIVAAGALIRENQVIPPGSIVVGLPGKVIGQVGENGIKEAGERARRYLELALKHV